MKERARWLRVGWSLLCGGYFVYHVVYLSWRSRFDYAYNIRAMVTIGLVHSALWLGWALVLSGRHPSGHGRNGRYDHHRPYMWMCVTGVAYVTAAMLLEVLDFPPLWRTFDAHSLWYVLPATTDPRLTVASSLPLHTCHPCHSSALPLDRHLATIPLVYHWNRFFIADAQYEWQRIGRKLG